MSAGREAGGFYVLAAGRIGPLNSTVFFDGPIAHAGVIAQPAVRYSLPFFKGVLWLFPSWKQLVIAVQLPGQLQEDLEIRLGFARRSNGAVHLAGASLRIGVSAFFLAPDGTGQHKVRQLGRSRWMKPILYHHEIQALQALLQDIQIGKPDN